MKFSKFFSHLQEAPWYRAFLNPVINQIGTSGKLLDIGTGSGKMIQILATEKEKECTGVDTNKDMLAEAKIKLQNINAELVEIMPNVELPFKDNHFDYVTICSVLFHMEKKDIDNMMNDSLRLLNNGGKIVILTPTGDGNIMKLSKHFFSVKNRGIYVWYHSTKHRAKLWTEENYIAEYAKRLHLKYKREVVMKGFAQLDIIEK